MFYDTAAKYILHAISSNLINFIPGKRTSETKTVLTKPITSFSFEVLTCFFVGPINFWKIQLIPGIFVSLRHVFKS